MRKLKIPTSPQKNRHMGFHGVYANNHVDHLMERYGKIWASDLEACRQALAEPIKAELPIDVYFQRVEDVIQFSQDRKTPFTPAQIVQTTYHAANKTGFYSLALKEWRKKATAEKTWGSSKQVFAEEYYDLVEETKVTNGDAGFHSANATKEIGGALAMAAVPDKDIVTNLTEAVDTLTRKNAYLTTQLSDATEINLDMPKKLNLKSTQSQEPEDKILAEKARKNDDFESYVDIDVYFCTHGFKVTKRHSIQTCSSAAVGHQRMDTGSY